METVEEVLEHHGIKGQKWGIRRKRGPEGTVASAAKHLSNEELQAAVTRMNLEKQFNTLSAKDAKGESFTKGLLKEIGKNQVKRVAKGAADIAVEQAIRQLGVKTESKGIVELSSRIKPKKK
jgi:hypothetical protein